MKASLKRKLNEHIEFVATGHPAGLDPVTIAGELLTLLSYPEQHAILVNALIDEVRSWIARRLSHSSAEQQVFPEFPHLPPLVRVGQQVLGFEHMTEAEVDRYYSELKERVREQEREMIAAIRRAREDAKARLSEELSEGKQLLREVGKVRRILKRYSRTNPEITVMEALERRAKIEATRKAGS